MANCKIHTDLDTGQISVEAPNGQPSKLFMDALELTNNQEQALEIWSVSETDNFKELITSQYENNGQAQEIEQTGVGVSEIHRRLTSFVGGYERAIRTHDAENERGQNRERIKRESVALIDYAKESGIFISNINETFEPTELGGAESEIYLDPNNPNVIIKEFVPYSHNGYQGALGRILLQNRLFPQTAYNVIGITQYGDYAALVLEQPFVKNARNATVEEIFQYVEDMGFEITSSNVGVYTAENQDGVILSDLHEGNLLVAPDGSMHLIDPQISYEGTIPFYQYIATVQPTSQVTTDENGEVDLSVVMSYIQASNAQTVEPMTPTEEQTVKNMLLSFDMPNSDYLNQRLQRLFPNGVFSLSELRSSTLFNQSEKKYISENTEAQNNLLRLSQQLNNKEDVIVNNLYENQDRNFIVYSGNKNKYGVDEVKNPAQVEQDIIDTVGGIRNREEFDSAFNSLPYESIIEEYNSNEETAHAYFERYSAMQRTPVQRIEENEVSQKNETDRATTVENTATLEKVDFREDIRFLSQVPNDVWEDSEQEVTEALTSIEAKGVTSAIDLQGLSESYSYKTQQEIVGFLATLNNLQNTPTETTLDNFIQSYREFFEVEATPSTEVQEIAEENLSKTIYKVENPATEYGMFNDHSLVKVDGNNYQKVQKQPIETMYEALYAQITRGQSRLPKRAYGDSNDKPTILGNIRNFVNGLLGGSVKIPNRVVDNVNPKTQALLITEYLKEKLGYNINVVSSEKVAEVLANKGVNINTITHNETVYGFHDPQTNEIYLTEEYLSSESLIHEMSHAYFPVIREQAAQGNKQAQTVIDRMESTAKSLIGKNTITDRYNPKTTNNTNIQPLIISEQGANNITKYKENLDRAKELRENDVPLSEISDQTGWYYFEGDWRMFSNETLRQFKLNDNLQTDTTYRLDQVLDSENILFTMYPSLADVTVLFSETPNPKGESNRAEYNPVSDNITIFEAIGRERQAILAHELSHAIQKREGLPMGGSERGLVYQLLRRHDVPQIFSPGGGATQVQMIKYYLNSIKNKDNTEAIDKTIKVLDYYTNGDRNGLYMMYRSITGEIDAHAATEVYRNYTEGQPNTTYEEILEEQLSIIRSLGATSSDVTSLRPDLNNIMLSASVYNPRQGESFEDYQERMIDEAMAVIMQENSVEYFERIAEENGLSEQQTKTFLQEIKDFIKQFSKWLSSQFGIDTVTEDMTNKELYNAVTTSMLRGDLTTNSPTLKEVTGGNVSFSVKEDSYDMDVAENLLLTKLYFKNPINPTPAENNLEVDRPFIESFDGGDYNYLSSDYISDFQTETLRQRNNDSVLYNRVYSQFAISESGIVPINTDNFSLENLKAAIEEHFTEKQYNDLKNYSVISKNRDIKQLFEIDPQQPTIEAMSQERVYYQNNLETLPAFVGDYQTINENSITTSEAGQNFIRINNSLYEKAQDAASQSFYRKIPTYNEVFNVITEQQPVDKFGYEEINPYLRTTETTQTTNNKYSREELENINEEYFSCNN